MKNIISKKKHTNCIYEHQKYLRQEGYRYKTESDIKLLSACAKMVLLCLAYCNYYIL